MELRGPGRFGWRRLLAAAPAFLATVVAVAWLSWMLVLSHWELDRLPQMDQQLPALERHVVGLQELSDARAGASK